MDNVVELGEERLNGPENLCVFIGRSLQLHALVIEHLKIILLSSYGASTVSLRWDNQGRLYKDPYESRKHVSGNFKVIATSNNLNFTVLGQVNPCTTETCCASSVRATSWVMCGQRSCGALVACGKSKSVQRLSALRHGRTSRSSFHMSNARSDVECLASTAYQDRGVSWQRIYVGLRACLTIYCPIWERREMTET